MGRKIEFEYNGKDLNKILRHFYGIPFQWCAVELEDFNIIHPNGKEDLSKIMENTIKVSFNDYEQDIKNNNLENSGGIYFISIAGLKNVYVGETLNFLERFKYHIKELCNKRHYNNKLQKAFNTHNKRLYVELFNLKNKTPWNKEDTLHELYMGFKDKGIQSDIWQEAFWFNNSKARPKSMKEVENYHSNQHRVVTIKSEQQKYKIIKEILKNRKSK